MRFSIQKAIAVGFGTALLLVSAIGVVSYRSIKNLLQNRVAVEHTYIVLQTIERAAARMAEAESHARGYMITGDSTFVRPDRSEESAVAGRIAALRQQTSDNPDQQRRLASLEQLSASRLRVLGEAIRLRRERGFEAARALVSAEQGVAAGDSIRRLVDAMENEEASLLHTRVEREQASLGRLTSIIALGIFVAFLISIVADAAIRRDLAERRQAEAMALEAKEAAESANRSKSIFLARMSHELRTPLNSVIGFANVLLKNRHDNLQPQDLSYLTRILANGKDLLALINDVLDLSKIEAGKSELSIVPAALDALVRDVIAQFEVDVRERRVVLSADLPDDMQSLDTDPGKLSQVLKNLVGNALKFTRQGHVTIAVHVDEPSHRPLRIDITDTGIGIPEERQQAVFEAFEQADQATAHQYGGTGLGLAISRSLCHLLGYRLEVASEPGRGSVFSVLLSPGGPAPALPPAAAPSVPAAAPVIVIDDDLQARTLLT